MHAKDAGNMLTQSSQPAKHKKDEEEEEGEAE